MRRIQMRRLVLGLGVLLLVVAGAAPLAAPIRAQADGRLVLAFYEATYDWSFWSQALCDEPVNLYISGDAATVERQVLEAQAAGIDALVQAWYGPEVAGNPTEANLQVLLDHAGRHGLEVAVQLDMTGDFLLTTAEVADAVDAVRNVHGRESAYLVVDGRPVIFFLGQDAFSEGTWQALRNQVDPDHEMIWIAEGPSLDPLDVFDGLYLYNVAATSDPASLLSRWGGEVRLWNLSHAGAATWVATVIPGFDNSALVGDAQAVVRGRDDGELYRDYWDAAVASAPDWIAVRSFNGWATCTQIETSVAHDDEYLMLTAELADMFRNPPLAATATATEPPEPTATPTDTPEPTPEVPTATPILTPTETLTPTATLTPSATPFRLATPTSMVPVGSTVGPKPPPAPGSPAATVPPGTTATYTPLPPPPGSTPTMTPMPRLPVEGYAPRRCSLLPILLPVAGVLTARGRRRKEGRGS